MFVEKKKNLLLFTVLSLIFLGIACSGKKKSDSFFEETVTFANGNWNYEYRIQEFNIDVKSSEKPYNVFFEIEHEPGLDLSELTFAVTFVSPSGGESSRNLMPQYNPEDIDSKVMAYREKYFNESGVYKFSIYRRYPKYDLYGIKSLTLKIAAIEK